MTTTETKPKQDINGIFDMKYIAGLIYELDKTTREWLDKELSKLDKIKK